MNKHILALDGQICRLQWCNAILSRLLVDLKATQPLSIEIEQLIKQAEEALKELDGDNC